MLSESHFDKKFYISGVEGEEEGNKQFNINDFMPVIFN